MGLDLSLLPFDYDEPALAFALSVLTCERASDLFDAITDGLGDVDTGGVMGERKGPDQTEVETWPAFDAETPGASVSIECCTLEDGGAISVAGEGGIVTFHASAAREIVAAIGRAASWVEENADPIKHEGLREFARARGYRTERR